MTRRRVIGFVAVVVLAAVVVCGIFLWLRRGQPLPAGVVSKLDVQLAPGAGFMRARVFDGSRYNVRSVTVRVFAYRLTGGYERTPTPGGWHITSSSCTFDPVTQPPDGYDLVFDRWMRFDAKLGPLGAVDVHAPSDFVPGADYWECRIVGASGYK